LPLPAAVDWLTREAIVTKTPDLACYVPTTLLLFSTVHEVPLADA
jgi:hypothetical protein